MRITSLARYQRTRRLQSFGDLRFPNASRRRTSTNASAPDGATICRRGGGPSSPAGPRTWCCAHGGRGRVDYVPETSPARTQAPRTPSRPITLSRSLRQRTPRRRIRIMRIIEVIEIRLLRRSTRLSTSPTSPSILRLEVHGVTNSGNDGADTAQRILHALRQTFDRSPHFSTAVPEKDLPKQWL
jgi:hypothetical protein